MKTARIFSLFSLLLSGCATLTPTPFIAPTAAPLSPTPVSEIRLPTGLPPTAGPSPTLSPSETPSPSPTPPCVPDLEYLSDLNYPDGTIVPPGSLIEKQWQVRNTGSCAWGAAYHLRLVQGFLPLGAAPEQALYPALSGQEVTLQITFTAPQEPGLYRSAWQAYDEQGNPFGQAVYIEIIVQ